MEGTHEDRTSVRQDTPEGLKLFLAGSNRIELVRELIRYQTVLRMVGEVSVILLSLT